MSTARSWATFSTTFPPYPSSAPRWGSSSYSSEDRPIYAAVCGYAATLPCRTLDGLPNGELSDAVTYLFAEDLREASASKQSVIIVDSYEALVPAPAYSGRVQLADAWLRDLAGQLDRALLVIASRERSALGELRPRLGQRHNGYPPWGACRWPRGWNCFRPGEFPTRQTASSSLTQARASPSTCILPSTPISGPAAGYGGGLVSQDEILARFLQHVAPEEIRSLEILSPARIFDYEIFRAARSRLPAARPPARLGLADRVLVRLPRRRRACGSISSSAPPSWTGFPPPPLPRSTRC